jgi:hypothetical protein
MLFGAAIGSSVNNIWLAIILAFLSHYLLDFIPHIDYSLKNTDKKGGILRSNILKISIDLFLGIFLIILFSKSSLPIGRQAVIYICAFFAILPDGLMVLNNLIPNNILEKHLNFHIEKIHFLKNKKIPKFWRFLSEIIVIVISIIMFKI